jgi:cellulose synthase/poly-beta-1,6-N-acetylglucosamine synthase-like glycosyltransferase
MQVHLPRPLGAPFDADTTLAYIDSPARRLLRKLAVIGGLAVYAAYLVYRALYTLNGAAPVFSTAVYLAELHGFFSLAFYYFQIWEVRRRTVPPPPPGLPVDVFITTLNEDVDLLRQTVRGALNMRYPHRTYVLDDGRRAEVKALCAELGCEYIRRDTNEDAKAGNWNNAFARTSGAFIATFDADHVPRADFLERTLGFFADPAVAFVQVPQRYHNLDSLQHRVDWRQRRLYGEQDVFFNLVMPGKDHWNASFFCGTGAVLRRQALVPHGGLVTGTITEDMHTALALQARGWKSVYLNELLVTGLAPMDFSSYSSQRLRWAEGNLKIIRHINPLTHPGLSLAQRLCYFASMYHWTIGFPKLVFYLAPPLILFTGQFPIGHFDRTFVAVYLAHLVSLVASYKLLARGTGRLFMDELFNMANFYTLLVASARFLVGRSRFVVTSKRGASGNDDRAVLPHYVLIAFTVMACVWSGLGLGFGVTEDAIGTGVAAFWALYNLALMTIVAAFARRPAQKRQAVRFRASVPVELLDLPANGWLGVTLDLAETGCTLLWPRRLTVGTRLKLRLHLGPHRLECDGEVMSVHDRVGSDWVGHGIRFHFAGPDGVDRLADALYNMAVPEIFTRLTRPSWTVRATRAVLSRLSGGTRFRAPRYEAYLPMRVQSREGDEWLATTRDLSQGGLSLVSPVAVQPGRVVRLILRSPDGEWSSLATVVRTMPMPGADASLRTWLLGLRVDGHADVVGLRHILSAESLV